MGFKTHLAKHMPGIISKGAGGALGGLSAGAGVAGGITMGAGMGIAGVATQGISKLVGAWSWIFMFILAVITTYLNATIVHGFLPKLIIYLTFFISYLFVFKGSET